MVRLPGRGTLFVRDLPGPPGAPAVMLIHGLGTNADLNWSTSYGVLRSRYRVVAPDLRGHGRGIRSRAPFRLEDCADDLASLADALAIRRTVAVGYSLGGLVAQVLWQRHRALVGGLVLCATARNLRGKVVERIAFSALPGIEVVARAVPRGYWAGTERVWETQLGGVHDEHLRRQLRDSFADAGLATMVSAGRAAAEFTSHEWIGQADVPTAVVVTTRDQVVSLGRQRRLAEAIPGATTFEVDADHMAFLQPADVFGTTLVRACRAVEASMGPAPATAEVGGGATA
jgi:pimeloyl-ACP methyl ester carboxylesterase